MTKILFLSTTFRYSFVFNDWHETKVHQFERDWVEDEVLNPVRQISKLVEPKLKATT